jgi:hypothetical protein
MIGQKTDEKKVEEMKIKLAASLDAYEQILSKQKYLSGDVRASYDLLKQIGVNLIYFFTGNHFGRPSTPFVW